MSMPVKLSEIVLGMETQSGEMRAYLDLRTGEVTTISDEEFTAADRDEPLEKFPEWQREQIKLAKEILESDEYLQLPVESGIDEYRIMENFCLSLDNEELRERLHHSIQGSGAFRRFRESIRRYGIEDQWYRFRDARTREIARDWCEYHKIAFVDQ